MSVKEITSSSFSAEVEQAEGVVLVDFWAPWCAPCRMMSPVIHEIAEEITDIKVCKVNVDDEFELASRFGIQGIPTLLFFNKGSVVNKSVGLIGKDEIIDLINESK